MPPQAIESRVEKLEEHVTNLQELPGRIDALSVQIAQVREDVVAQISATERTLREDIVSGDERILAKVRVWHEDVVSRLAWLQEGQPGSRRRRT